MKKLFLFFALSVFSNVFCQGEQLYANGVATDQNGNEFEWINYGTQDWAIENAKVVTYRDGTPIPQVTDNNNWNQYEEPYLETGAWTFMDNDPTQDIVYNWWAVAGIDDTDPNTPNKEFAPDGWRVPTDADWTTLENWLITNGYNYDGTTTENKLAKAMASATGWDSSTNTGAVGNDQSINNSSGFNSLNTGYCPNNASGFNVQSGAYFWSTTIKENATTTSWQRHIRNLQGQTNLTRIGMPMGMGVSVRFVRDAQPASINDNSTNRFKIFPNPTLEFLNINSLSLDSATIYNILGEEVLKVNNENRIDVSSLSKGVYFIKVSNGINSATKKFIKN